MCKTEQELLQDIFGVTDLFQGKYRILWCDMCETWTLSCPDCRDGAGGGSCSSVCDKCRSAQAAFDALVPMPIRHLSENEQRIVRKYQSLKRHLLASLIEGVPLKMKARNERGELSRNDQRLFGIPERLADSHSTTPASEGSG